MQFKKIILVLVVTLLTFNLALAENNKKEDVKKEKKTFLELKEEINKRQVKKDEIFKKKISIINEVLNRIEKIILEGKISEARKEKILLNLNERIEKAELMVEEMNKNLKMLEEHIKIAQETLSKAKAIQEKLKNYNPAPENTNLKQKDKNIKKE